MNYTHLDIEPLLEKLRTERAVDIALLSRGMLVGILRRRLEKAGVSTVLAYVRTLDDDPGEYLSLMEELFGPPDGLFQDDLLTSLLELRLIPGILSRKKPGDRIRIWVPQCGKGYQAYDLAIILWKLLHENPEQHDIKVIGTDADEAASTIGRQQQFPIEYFERLSGMGVPIMQGPRGPRVAPEIRNMLIMGVHDLFVRPPYPTMDMVLCTGYLPLLEKPARERVKAKFVQSLTRNGKLVLGRGEIIGLGEEKPSDVQPFPIFTKHLERPFELTQIGSRGVKPVPTQESFVEKLRVPAFILSPMGTITQTNSAAEHAFGTDSGLQGMDIRFMEPAGIFMQIDKAARQARQIRNDERVPNADGWVGGMALLPDAIGDMGSLVVVLIPARVPEGLSKDEKALILASREETAVQTARIAADMGSYDQERMQLREQAAIITEGLYTRSEELAQAREELESRNTQLHIANLQLSRIIVEREDAEREVRTAYEREHRIAQTLQQVLLTPIPDRVDGFELAAAYRPGFEEAEIGGDFYHASWLPQDRYYVTLGDVSGKGLEAAVYAYMTKYMQMGFVSETPEPEQLFPRLNEALLRHSDIYRFVSLAYLLFDLTTHSIHYGSAGHEPAILCRAQTGETSYLEPTGMLLGVESRSAYTGQTLDLQPNDLLLLYSDGLSDAGTAENRLGAEGIAKIMCCNYHETPERILEILYETATRMSGGKLTDDATSILVKRRAD